MMRFRNSAITCLIIGAMAGCGADDGKDGTDGKDALISTTTAAILTLNVTSATITEQILTVNFSAENEYQLPVIAINNIQVSAAQLMPAVAKGENNNWLRLVSENCKVGDCTGNLTDNKDGSYQYTLATSYEGAIDVNFDPALTERVLVKVQGNDIPQTYAHLDFVPNGEVVSETKNIVDADNCTQCHDGIDKIHTYKGNGHGGNDLANCQTCHTANVMEPGDVWSTMAHSKHAGVSSMPVGNCASCHLTEVTDSAQQALDWKTIPTRQSCENCHDMASNEVYDHKEQATNEMCSTCHRPSDIEGYHLGAIQKSDSTDQRRIVTVDLEAAKLIDGSQCDPTIQNCVAGEQYAKITFSLLDKAGKKISVEGGNPMDANWIKNLQLYVNWGNNHDFLSGRGYTIYVKSNKHINRNFDGMKVLDPNSITSEHERHRTVMYSTEDNSYTYVMGPIITKDAISGDTLNNDGGFISERLIYCFDDDQNLMDCDASGNSKNTSYNHRWFFTKDGLTTDPDMARPAIVSGDLCSSCHGRTDVKNNTMAACRSCHSRNTELNKEEADTTCFSGHDHDENDNDILPREFRPLKPRAQAGFISSTSDMVDPCTACHNPNTPPTQAIRELHTLPGDKYYAEELTLTHPDHKIWMHSLHTNQRATQNYENGIRNVNYPAEKANCYRCHEGDTFDLKRLEKFGRPLALRLDYADDSKAYPAIDAAKSDNGSIDYNQSGADVLEFAQGQSSKAMTNGINAYSSPIAATCFSCHAKTTDKDGNRVINGALVSHIEQNGGRFGVPLDGLQTESCSVCHSLLNIKEVHNLNK